MKKVGILGGIFDPVHIGHLHIAEGVYKALNLSKIILVPAGNPPHKETSPYASGSDRMVMLAIAVGKNPLYEISDTEINRKGKSYTVDTLNALRRDNPEWELYFIIGGDNLTEILTWKNPAEIFKLATVVLVNRPGSTIKISEVDLPGEVTEISLPGKDVSSTDIRQRIKKGEPFGYLLPDGVEEYILKKKLYI